MLRTPFTRFLELLVGHLLHFTRRTALRLHVLQLLHVLLHVLHV